MQSSKQSLSIPLSALGVFTSRLGFLPANLSPLGSFGFFSQNYLLYFTTIIIFDWLVGGFYPGFWMTYLGFAAYPLLGKVAKNTHQRLILLPLASFLFFLISNAGVWWDWYPHTLEGLTTCYLLAIPFYTRTLLGDLGFGYGYLGLKAIWSKLSQHAPQQLGRPSPQL